MVKSEKKKTPRKGLERSGKFATLSGQKRFSCDTCGKRSMIPTSRSYSPKPSQRKITNRGKVARQFENDEKCMNVAFKILHGVALSIRNDFVTKLRIFVLNLLIIYESIVKRNLTPVLLLKCTLVA